MSIEVVKANLIWENNSDTELSSNNLSKMLDYQSDSKFINYTNSNSDYEEWADIVFESLSDDFSGYESVNYVNQVIYNLTTHTAKKITKVVTGTSTTYSALDYTSPYKKLLKISANTKIALNYTVSGKTYYNSFDVGSVDKLFSTDHLILGSDFSASTSYEIYLYYHISYGDYAQIKIMAAGDSSWKTTAADTSSPSGYKLISYRKIGGFQTNASGYIDESSIWDISTYTKEVCVETLKKFDASEDEIREFSAVDIPVADAAGIINATNVEQALAEIKKKVDTLYDDLYTVNKYGVDLIFCPIKKDGNGNFAECVTHDLTLKITAGYIDVYGTRVAISDDIYLSSPTTAVKLNSNTVYTTPATLGDPANSTPTNTVSIYDSSTDNSGTIWRVFIDINGKISIREDSKARPQYYCQGKLKGWYYNAARCIGKFKVRKSTFYYIEKQSVLNTVDRELFPNEVVMVHGTVCPDGTIPCDGYWHDTLGTDSYTYTVRPALSRLLNTWYEETPNFWGKVPKMPSTNVLSVGPYTLNSSTGAVTSGGSADTGASGGSDTHYHAFAHAHGPGTLKIVESGDHTHDSTDIEFTDVSITESVYVVPDQTSNSSRVTTDKHTHTMVIGGGAHSHNSSDFMGSVATLSGTSANTDSTSSWSPYKEVLFCIRK